MPIDPWYMVLVDAFITMLAAIGAIFGVVIIAYCAYRIVVAVGFIVRFVVAIIFGDRTVDGVPHYQDDDYP